jgi:ABC-type hemin transport system ATPase subunit
VRISGGRASVGLARAIAAAAPGLPDSWSWTIRSRPSTSRPRPDRHVAEAGVRHRRACQDRVTIIACSHRLAAFPYADLVVVLQDGRIDAVELTPS